MLYLYFVKQKKKKKKKKDKRRRIIVVVQNHFEAENTLQRRTLECLHLR